VSSSLSGAKSQTHFLASEATGVSLERSEEYLFFASVASTHVFLLRERSEHYVPERSEEYLFFASVASTHVFILRERSEHSCLPRLLFSANVVSTTFYFPRERSEHSFLRGAKTPVFRERTEMAQSLRERSEQYSRTADCETSELRRDNVAEGREGIQENDLSFSHQNNRSGS
jgi:hypothetical protein